MRTLVVALALLTTSALADLPLNPVFTWTLPTQYNDGSALPVEDLAEVRINCTGAGVIQDTISSAVTDPITGDITPVGTTFTPVPGTLVVGDYSCSLTVVDTTGIESVPSNTITFNIGQKSPNAIINFGVI